MCESVCVTNKVHMGKMQVSFFKKKPTQYFTFCCIDGAFLVYIFCLNLPKSCFHNHPHNSSSTLICKEPCWNVQFCIQLCKKTNTWIQRFLKESSERGWFLPKCHEDLWLNICGLNWGQVGEHSSMQKNDSKGICKKRVVILLDKWIHVFPGKGKGKTLCSKKQSFNRQIITSETVFHQSKTKKHAGPEGIVCIPYNRKL